MTFLHRKEVVASIVPPLRVNIVRQDEGKLFPFRPAIPIIRRTTTSGINGPVISASGTLKGCDLSAQGELQTPRNQRPDIVINFYDCRMQRITFRLDQAMYL